MRSRASSFKWEYPLLSLRWSSSFLRLLPRLLVTSISPFIFPSITCFRRHFLRKMWPIQIAFRLLISCRIFLCSLTLSNTSSFLTTNVLWKKICFILYWNCLIIERYVLYFDNACLHQEHDRHFQFLRCLDAAIYINVSYNLTQF